MAISYSQIVPEANDKITVITFNRDFQILWIDVIESYGGKTVIACYRGVTKAKLLELEQRAGELSIIDFDDLQQMGCVIEKP